MPDLTDLQVSADNKITVYLTAAQILALFATPVQVLPPLPAGFFYNCRSCIVKTSPGTAYAGGGTVQLIYASGPVLAPIATAAVIQNAAKQIANVNMSLTTSGLAASQVDGQAMQVNNITGAFTTGNGTLAIVIYYSIEQTNA